MTYGDLLDRSLEEKRLPIEPTTVSLYQWLARTYIGPALGDRKLASTRPIDLDPYASLRRVGSALQTAFMNCGVFAALYEGVTKGQPVDAQNLGAKAVHEFGISPSAVDRFASSFVDSAVAAGLAEPEDGQIVLLDADGDLEAADIAAGDDTGAKAPRAESSRGRVRSSAVPPVVHQEWTVPAGHVLFEVRLDRPLPAGVFAQVGTVVEAIEALASRLLELTAAGDAGG